MGPDGGSRAWPGRAMCGEGGRAPSGLPGVTWPVRWQVYTPLHMAAEMGHGGIVVDLVKAKADVNSADNGVSLARPPPCGCGERACGRWGWGRVGGREGGRQRGGGSIWMG